MPQGPPSGRTVVNAGAPVRLCRDVEDELPGVLDGVDEPVTVAELEAVVRRAGQRRQATLVAGAAVLLALGGVGGAVARGHDDRRYTAVGLGAGPVAGSASAAKGAASSASMAFGGSGGFGGPFTPLFRREANGVAIRAYRISMAGGPEAADPACAEPTSLVQVELSNAAAVGMLSAAEPPAKARLEATGLTVAANTFGYTEGEPATGAVVQTGAGIATVRITSPVGDDTMAPQDGVAVLAVAGEARADYEVQGLGPDGAVVARQPLIPPPPTPVKVMPAPRAGGSTTGSGSATDGVGGSVAACGPVQCRATTTIEACVTSPPSPCRPDAPMPTSLGGPTGPQTSAASGPATSVVGGTKTTATARAAIPGPAPACPPVDPAPPLTSQGPTSGTATTVAPPVPGAQPTPVPGPAVQPPPTALIPVPAWAWPTTSTSAGPSTTAP